MKQYLSIGKITKTHGVKGELKVYPLTDDSSRYKDLKWVYVENGSVLEKYNVIGVKFLKDLVIIKFENIDDIDKAEKLRGLYLKVDRENAIKLPEDRFFICDLLGCNVYEENSKLLGVLTEVLKTGSNDVYVVKNSNNKEILIPVLKSVIKNICIEDKKIEVCLPEGLLDIYEI